MAVALAALEIGLKEAPEARLGLAARARSACPVAASQRVGFVRRSAGRVRSRSSTSARFADRNFAIGCLLSFVLGIGLFGSVYLMPVFLAFVREHGPLADRPIMLVTGIAQLVDGADRRRARAPRRRPAADCCAASRCSPSGSASARSRRRETDFDEMFWPQVLRGSAIMFCLLPPTRLALGHFPRERVPDASGLFNLMRNLGGAIGLALIDTVIYGRAPILAEEIGQRLKRGDVSVSPLVGIPPETVATAATRTIDAALIETVRPLVERAGLVGAINEAWAMLAAITALALWSCRWYVPAP